MDFNTHDVCSLIKRFFREISSPLFTDNQSQILKFVETLNDEQLLVQTLFTLIEHLPTANFCTIAYVMRQLKKVKFINYVNIDIFFIIKIRGLLDS